jgi:hypothetical protein
MIPGLHGVLARLEFFEGYQNYTNYSLTLLSEEELTVVCKPST